MTNEQLILNLQVQIHLAKAHYFALPSGESENDELAWEHLDAASRLVDEFRTGVTPKPEPQEKWILRHKHNRLAFGSVKDGKTEVLEFPSEKAAKDFAHSINMWNVLEAVSREEKP